MTEIVCIGTELRASRNIGRLPSLNKRRDFFESKRKLVFCMLHLYSAFLETGEVAGAITLE